MVVGDQPTVDITTTEPQQVVTQIKEAWKPILTTLQPVTDVEWQPVLDLFDGLDLPDMKAEDVRGPDLRRSITQMKTRSASGLDGWKVAELALLTDGQLDLLASLFKQCENYKL